MPSLPVLCPEEEPSIERCEPWSSCHHLPAGGRRRESFYRSVCLSVILPRGAVGAVLGSLQRTYLPGSCPQDSVGEHPSG